MRNSDARAFGDHVARRRKTNCALKQSQIDIQKVGEHIFFARTECPIFHPRRITLGIRTRGGELPEGIKENRAFLAFWYDMIFGVFGRWFG